MKSSQKTVLPFILSLLFSTGFTLLIWLLAPRLDRFILLPDQGPKWYYWKLPQPELWARISAWGGYALHQILIWVIVFLGMKEKPHPDRLSRLNIAALTINAVFIVLHLVQSQIWYDGLAQDVPIWTSQYSVIVMLVLILIMMTRRRGFFLGRKIPILPATQRFVRRFHAPFIAWALVYTFWFHPMEGDFAILVGFLYMFLLLTQLSFFNTRIHFNIYWITLLEVFVALHGPAIAIMNGQEIWPMFLFGFLFMFVFTQMHGIIQNRGIRIGILIGYFTAFFSVYYVRGFGKIYELTFIPVSLYGGALGAIAVLYLIFKLIEKRKPLKRLP